jgi:hypothetical protein
MSEAESQVQSGGATDKPEAELQEQPGDVVTRWLRELKSADQHERDWREQAQKVVDLYKDARKKDENSSEYRFNLLYANTEVLKGTMYSQCPVPDIRRRFLDKDPTSRIAALVLTRAVSTAMDLYDFDGAMRDCVQDMVLPGRGGGRVKYHPVIAKTEKRVPVEPMEGAIQPDVKQDAQGFFRMEQVEEVVDEKVQFCYQEWGFYRQSPASRKERIRWKAYGELLTRDDLKAQFPDCADKVELKWMPKGVEDSQENAILKRALVWTIWNKPDRKVYVICDGYQDAPIKVMDDPLRLEQFFPEPDPLYSIRTNESLIPTPEYVIYQDHARQLDEMNERIAVLTEALRRRGVYDASIEELEKLGTAGDNKFIPVKNYREFMEKGGIEAAFQELDISGLAAVLVQVMQQAELKKAQIYELIGISDIMRGATKATETLGAQQLKSQYGSIRSGPRQQEVQRFARDAIRLMAEIIAEHFSPQTLAQMTGVDLFFTEQEKAAAAQAMQPQLGMPAPQQAADPRLKRPTWEAVMQIIKSDKLRGFKIDIETDSTIRAQADEEQKNRTEALTSLTGFFKETLPAVQSGAVPKKIVMELASFGLRAFKVGPQLEDLLDEWGESEGDGGQAQQQQMQKQEQQAVMQHAQAMRQFEQEAASANAAKAQAEAYKAIIEAEALEAGSQLDLLRQRIEVKTAAAQPAVPEGATVQ